MKLSIKFREETPQKKPPLLRAKIPVTILGLPFLSGVVAGDSSDLSFSLRSNFSTGPSLSLSYHPTLSPLSSSFPPFSLSLKSGVGVFGSPHNSPLIFSANLNLFSAANLNSLSPFFSLHFKPQFGNFSLLKSVDSVGNSSIKVDGHGSNPDLGNGSVSDFENGARLGDGSVKGQIMNSWKREKDGILSGIFVAARTAMPVAKRAVVNFRWGVNFPAEGSSGRGMKSGLPVLVMNKVSLERVDEEGKKRVEEEERRKKKEGEEAKAGDLELLKGMCGWMRREVEDLQRKNREMKMALEGMRFKQGPTPRGRGEERENVEKRMVHSPLPAAEGQSDFDRWRSKKNGCGDENGNREMKKGSSGVSELENELQKAIKAASS